VNDGEEDEESRKALDTIINIPGFNGELSIGPNVSVYRGRVTSGGERNVIPQLGHQLLPGVDLGAYLRCRANGGGDLVCRFFGGLPPFTIGGLLF
jgi:hypothetical protein